MSSKLPTELRNTLMDCIAKVRTGGLSPGAAKSVAMLAQQVNLSLQVEMNMNRAGIEIPSAPPMLPSPAASEEPTDVPAHPDPASLARAPWPGVVTRHRLADDD